MLEIVVLVAFMGFVLLCSALSFGRAPQSGKTEITRPTADSVDGFGGIRGYDYSYASTYRDSKPPLPVSLRLEREKIDTHRAFSERKGREQQDKK